MSLFFSISSLVALMYFFYISETSILAFSIRRVSKMTFYSVSFSRLSLSFCIE
jgi:hypothetical protein